MSDNEANGVLDDVQHIGQMESRENGVVRGVDREANVVLYLAHYGDEMGGLTAVPIQQTHLE